MSINRMFGFAFGAVYVLIGLAGFAITGETPFAATEGPNLIIFSVNPLHNVIHIAVGGLFIAGAAAGALWSKRVNILIGAVYLAVGAVGLFMVGSELNFLALNHADNILHFATALLAIAVGSWESTPARSRMLAQS